MIKPSPSRWGTISKRYQFSQGSIVEAASLQFHISRKKGEAAVNFMDFKDFLLIPKTPENVKSRGFWKNVALQRLIGRKSSEPNIPFNA